MKCFLSTIVALFVSFAPLVASPVRASSSYEERVGCVQNFEINERCYKSYPCVHHCSITLMDGRTANLLLNGETIYTLIHAIDSSKVVTECPEHFDIYATSAQNSLSTAEDILDEIFGYTISRK